MKYEFDDNNKQELKELDSYEWDWTQDIPNQKKGKAKKNNMMKKSITFGLCAIMAGALAVGGYQGARYFSGAENVIAAETNGEETKLTMTAKKTTSDTETKDTKESTSRTGSLDVSDIAEEAMPSIVSITTKSVQEVQSYYGMFGGFGGYAPSTEQEVEGSGSGIIVGKNDTELLIATNYHVVEGADTISVAFADNEAYEGKVKGYDDSKDLAVVAVTLEDISDSTLSAISVAKIGSSDDLKVGEQVVAIGNALGYGQSVTTGIVSAKNRYMDSSSGEMGTLDENTSGVNLIQTDAAINPGNSGGALLNMDGELVGINSAKLASTEVEGMGYAIAISDVTDILERLMNAQTRDKLADEDHGVLGIMGASVSSEASKMYGMPQGVYISEITAGGAAEKAGLPEKAIITKFDGRTVTSIEELIGYLAYYEPGETVEITYSISNNGSYEEKTVDVTLGEQTDTDTNKDADDKDTKNTEENADTEDTDENIDDNFGDSTEDDYNGGEASRQDIMDGWGEGLFGVFR
ncbi:MAG: trypsin-like peptidase domain-containing protein [Eubacteriales bacterium]|nr:trypsin-like peptidase domain-containing protein [Eubacteriales bacterium]